MKKVLMLAVLGLSASVSAFAQFCEVDMVDSRTLRTIQTFQSSDAFDGCKEGMKACRMEIRMRGLVNLADCVRDTDRPRPIPGPGPRPVPGPHPRPIPGPHPIPTPVPRVNDAHRHIQNGESVIMNHSYYTVLGATLNGNYALKNNWGQIINNVRREKLAVTQGCNYDLCTGDQLISLSSHSYVTVVGLEFDDRFVTKNNWGQLTMNVDRSKLALTKGCMLVGGHRPRFSQEICVGNQVINQHNAYSTVVGLQNDGRVVLKNNWGQLTINVNPENLVITR